LMGEVAEESGIAGPLAHLPETVTAVSIDPRGR